MAMSKEQIEELKKNIGFARKADLPFGLCLGKKPETTLLKCHKTKNPATLGKQAKKEGETNKFTFGNMSCKGKNLSLTCIGEVPPGLARRVKEMFKSANLPLRIIILDPEGGSLEADGEGDEEEEVKPTRPRNEVEPEAVAEKSQPAPDTPKTAGSARSAAEDTPADAKADAPAASADDGSAAAELEKRRRQWEVALEKLQPHIDNILANKLSNAKKIDALWTLANSKATATPPDFTVALKSVTVVAKLVAEAKQEDSKAGAAAESAEPDADASSGSPPGDTTSEIPPEEKANRLASMAALEQNVDNLLAEFA